MKNAASTDIIVSDYQDPYLELVSLLNEGAGLEHSLMLSYLYVAFSLKDRYADLRGKITLSSYQEHSPGHPGGEQQLRKDSNLLEVCIEEMQHLSTVNQFLVALGASPNFMPHIFPYSSDIYPFRLDLLPLDRYVAATFMWVEADSCALNLDARCKGKGEPEAFKREVHEVLQMGAMAHHGIPIDENHPSHLGSLYNKVLKAAHRVAQQPPQMIPSQFPWGQWQDQVHWLVNQGELAHYRFFRALFTGEAFGTDASIWKDPEDPAYPSLQLRRGTAYRNRRRTIDDEDVREIAWLADLHYWIILTLLDTAFTYSDPYANIQRKYLYKTIGVMTGSLWALGLDLARRGWGMPFDQMGTQYTVGTTEMGALQHIQFLIYEARGHAQRLASRGLLPADYSMKVFDFLLSGLLQPSNF
jgi:hypothetical protein